MDNQANSAATRSQSKSTSPRYRVLQDRDCGNGCGSSNTTAIRAGVGQLKVIGYRCTKCGNEWNVPTRIPRREWQPDRAYEAGLSYAAGYSE